MKEVYNGSGKEVVELLSQYKSFQTLPATHIHFLLMYELIFIRPRNTLYLCLINLCKQDNICITSQLPLKIPYHNMPLSFFTLYYIIFALTQRQNFPHISEELIL